MALPAGVALLILASFLPRGAAKPEAIARDAAGGLGGWAAAAHLLGGFRPLAVDALWLRADSLFREGRLWELAALFRGIAALDPGNAAVREYAAWHLAYNVALAEPEAERRFDWFLRGMEAVGAAPGSDPPGAAAKAFAARMLVDRLDAGIIPGFAARVARLWGEAPLPLSARWLEAAAESPDSGVSVWAYLLYCYGRLEAETEESGAPRGSRDWGDRKGRALARATALFPEEDWTAWR
jgi:hypothetical protein